MSKQIIINTDSEKTRIAIMEDGELAELFIETEEHERTLGNLFVGRIRRIMPSIQAAFVDIGQKQDAFLHFSDLSENLADWLAYLGEETPEIGRYRPQHLTTHKGRRRRRPLHGRRHDTDAADDPEEEDEFELEDEEGGDDSTPDGGHHSMQDAKSRGRRRSMQRRLSPRSKDDDGSDRDDDDDGEPEGPPVHTLLQRDQSILVKISKEPIAQKGSRITTDISLAGRFLVLVPMANYVAVSKKIASFKERRRLRALAKSLLPDGFGVIVRTVAQNQTAKTLDTDLRLLVDRWRKIEAKLAGRPKPPVVVHEDVNMVSSVIRDLFSDNYDRIVVDNQRLYRNVKSYVQAVAPDMGVTVQLHQSSDPVFKAAGIDRRVAEAFERRINLPSGAYLFFEQTEAMHVIDVNSGRAGKGMSQEDSSLKVNLEAARAIARQIRLRDLGGIVVVDFIDLRSERSRRKVLEELKKEFRRDRAVTKVLPMSDFGLIQITRQRLRPSITTTFSDLHQPEEGGAPPAGRSEGSYRMAMPIAQTADSLTPEALIETLEDWIRRFRKAGHRTPVKLLVHPFVAAFLNRRIPSQTTRWFLRFGQRVRIESDVEQDVSGFRWYDVATGEEVTRIPEKPKAVRETPPKPAETEKEDSSDRSRRGRGGRGRRGGSRDRRQGGRDDERGDRRQGSRDNERGERRPGGRDEERGDRRQGGRGEERSDRRQGGRDEERGDRRPGGRDEERGDRRQGGRGEERGDRRQGQRSEERDDRRQGQRSEERGDRRPGDRDAGDAKRDDRPQEDGQGTERRERSGSSRSGRGRRGASSGSRRQDDGDARREEPKVAPTESNESMPAEQGGDVSNESGKSESPSSSRRRGTRGGRGRSRSKEAPADSTAPEGADSTPAGDSVESSAATEEKSTRRRGSRGRGGRGSGAKKSDDPGSEPSAPDRGSDDA